MKWELYSFFHRKINIIFIYVIFMVFSAMTIYIVKNTKGYTTLTGSLGIFNSREEFDARYKEARETLKSEMELDADYYAEQLALYEYIDNNYIDSDQATLYSVVFPCDSRDLFGMFVSTKANILLIMLITMAFLGMTVLSSDSGDQGHASIHDKFLVYVLLSLVSFIILEIVNGVYIRVASEPGLRVLAYINGRVKGYSTWTIMIIEAISMLIKLLPFLIAFFFFRVLLKNNFLACIADILTFLVIGVLPGVIDVAPIKYVGMAPFYAVAMGDCSFKEWLVGYMIVLIPILAFSFYSICFFRKNNLA